MPKNNKRPGGKTTSRKNRTSLSKPIKGSSIQESSTIHVQPETNPSSIAADSNFDNLQQESKPIEKTPISAPQSRQVLTSVNDVFFKKELKRIALLGSVTTLTLAIISFTMKSN